MASTEYDHCKNCFYWDKEKQFCDNLKESVSKKGWCGEHFRKDTLDANDIAVEYDIRTDHMLLEMSGRKVNPIEDVLKNMGWDGVERLKQGKFPEDKLNEDDDNDCKIT